MTTDHTEQSPLPHLCIQCEEIFNNFYQLQEHVKENHEVLRPYCCTLCPKKFKHHKGLELHFLELHKEEKLSKVSCPKCFKTFSTKFRLRAHMMHIHEENRPFACKHCNHSCSRERGLMKHILTVHKGIKPNRELLCPQCPKILASSSSLKDHISSVHEKCKQICSYCGKEYNLPGTLRKHILLEHELTIQHDCKKCEQQFTSKYDLKLHDIGKSIFLFRISPLVGI